MGEKLLTLEEWAAEKYGNNPPPIMTLRRWVRESKIYPAPEKHGKRYYVRANARYSDPRKPLTTPQKPRRPRLVERI